MTKEELLRRIREAIRTEEVAISIYLRHLSAITLRSGLPEEKIRKIRDSFESLNEWNRRHKKMLEDLAAQVEREALDAY